MVAAPAALLALAGAVLLARWWRDDPVGAAFIADFPGTVTPPPGTPEGFPAWLSWTHYLNAFFLLFIVSSGLHVRSRSRPIAFVTRRNAGLLRTTTAPQRLGIHTWWHLVVVVLWIATGLVYVVLLLASGHWARLLPTDWAVVPNAISAGVQYLSLDWPAHDSWRSYNSLQVLFYSATVFVAAPLALVTGLRLSSVWPRRWMRATGLLGDLVARRTHAIVLWYYLAFTVVHVGLVFLSGARANLNGMYAGFEDATSWLGVAVFALSTLVMVVAWVLLRPPAQVAIAERVADVRHMHTPPR
jgi:thiosulfate reductase cytochrome b subunit